MSMANFLLMSKKQQRAVVGDEALKKVAVAFKAVEQAMSSQQQSDDNIMSNDEETNDEVFAENIYSDTYGVLDEEQFFDDHYDDINFEIEGADQESGTRHIMEDQNLSSGSQVGGNEETRAINLGIVKKTRGSAYCRKLTTLPPGEKLTVEFDNDGIPVGSNGSSQRHWNICGVVCRGFFPLIAQS